MPCPNARSTARRISPPVLDLEGVQPDEVAKRVVADASFRRPIVNDRDHGRTNSELTLVGDAVLLAVRAGAVGDVEAVRNLVGVAVLALVWNSVSIDVRARSVGDVRGIDDAVAVAVAHELVRADVDDRGGTDAGVGHRGFIRAAYAARKVDRQLLGRVAISIKVERVSRQQGHAARVDRGRVGRQAPVAGARTDEARVRAEVARTLRHDRKARVARREATDDPVLPDDRVLDRTDPACPKSHWADHRAGVGRDRRVAHEDRALVGEDSSRAVAGNQRIDDGDRAGARVEDRERRGVSNEATADHSEGTIHGLDRRAAGAALVLRELAADEARRACLAKPRASAIRRVIVDEAAVSERRAPVEHSAAVLSRRVPVSDREAIEDCCVVRGAAVDDAVGPLACQDRLVERDVALRELRLGAGEAAEDREVVLQRESGRAREVGALRNPDLLDALVRVRGGDRGLQVVVRRGPAGAVAARGRTGADEARFGALREGVARESDRCECPERTNEERQQGTAKRVQCWHGVDPGRWPPRRRGAATGREVSQPLWARTH